MPISVSSATQAAPVAEAAVAAQPVPADSQVAQPKPQPVAKGTVQISSAARAALAEATETPAQTAKEARAGDRQAQRLLAHYSAAKDQAK
jgi:hypothetical protein